MATWLVGELGGKGNVLQMNGIAGVDTAEIMAAGAQDVWAKNPDIKVLDVQYGNWSTAEAKKIAEQWIAQYGDQINGIWSGGAQMSQGIVEAYLDAGVPLPPIAGGEYANGFLRLAKENNINFSAWQYPNAMSILCIDTAVKVLKGEPVPRFIDFKDELPTPRTSASPSWTSSTIQPGATTCSGRSSCRTRR